MSGLCYFCQAKATEKAQSLTTGEIHYVCKSCYNSMKRVEEGQNSGAGVGIG